MGTRKSSNKERSNEIEKANMPELKNEYYNNTKIASAITEDEEMLLDGTAKEIVTLPRVNVSVAVSLKSDERVELSSENIFPFDMAVLDAVCTLYEHKCTSFTPSMIVRTMTGRLEQRVSPVIEKEVIESLDKMMHIFVRIDCTEEFRKRGLPVQDKRFYQESYMIPLTKIDIRTANNRKLADGYKLLDEPILYTYAQAVGQVICVPMFLLDTKKTCNDTKENILIKKYLITRIEMMKNSKNNILSNRIIYERKDSKTGKDSGAFSALGYKKSNYTNWRNKKAAIHEAFCEILSDFIKKEFIDSFEIIKDGQSIIGIEINTGTFDY